MASGLSDAIRMLIQDKGISEELILRTIEEFLLAAYKKKFGNADNAVVKFSDDGTEVTLYAQRQIVEDVYDPVSEIELEDALKLNDDCEIGDELLIEIDPKEFDRGAVQSAKQKAKQTLREIQKDTLYSEYKDKVGDMIIGYYQRERNGNIFVDLGKTEGLLPKRYQSPREIYRVNDRIKALIYEVTKAPAGLQIILSRTHTDFVRRVFELEVPEVYDKTVEIFKIVREPGYRTKLAVYSNRDDVDPVGACVGLRGVRIQAIVRELEGEKIDILKYDNDPREFIRNALSPAEVSQVVILDEAKRQALAVVPDTQLSLAIGKQGLNVRLANRLVDWNIDVKTLEQFDEMDISAESKRAVSALFGDYDDDEEITAIAELPDMPTRITDLLKGRGIEMIEDLVTLNDDDLLKIEGLSADDIATIRRIVTENIEIVEQDDEDELGEKDADESEDAADGGPDETSATDDDTSEPNREPAAELTDVTEADEEDTADTVAEEEEEEDEYDEEEITLISELPSISERVVAALEKNNIVDVVDLVSMSEDELQVLPGLNPDDVADLRRIISENVEIIEQDDDEAEEE
ncbi:MAG: transcription termination/antitermination protein NusA [Spirochaetaceae bacterium]|nr:MAG: transcription termination/antitermination protein NusA [Spirochaetaceae bacterium]